MDAVSGEKTWCGRKVGASVTKLYQNEEEIGEREKRMARKRRYRFFEAVCYNVQTLGRRDVEVSGVLGPEGRGGSS